MTIIITIIIILPFYSVRKVLGARRDTRGTIVDGGVTHTAVYGSKTSTRLEKTEPFPNREPFSPSKGVCKKRSRSNRRAIWPKDYTLKTLELSTFDGFATENCAGGPRPSFAIALLEELSQRVMALCNHEKEQDEALESQQNQEGPIQVGESNKLRDRGQPTNSRPYFIAMYVVVTTRR